jgi:CheY-like chemotaxis protein
MEQSLEDKIVLVIDEDIESVQLVNEILETEGLRVFIVTDPAMALPMAEQVNPSLILINLVLSNMNGLQISKTIHDVEELKSVPIILFTKDDEGHNLRYVTRYGIVGFLRKPFSNDELISKTIQAISGAEVEREGDMSGEYFQDDDITEEVFPETDVEAMDIHADSEIESREESFEVEDGSFSEEMDRGESGASGGIEEEKDELLDAQREWVTEGEGWPGDETMEDEIALGSDADSGFSQETMEDEIALESGAESGFSQETMEDDVALEPDADSEVSQETVKDVEYNFMDALTASSDEYQRSDEEEDMETALAGEMAEEGEPDTLNGKSRRHDSQKEITEGIQARKVPKWRLRKTIKRSRARQVQMVIAGLLIIAAIGAIGTLLLRDQYKRKSNVQAPPQARVESEETRRFEKIQTPVIPEEKGEGGEKPVISTPVHEPQMNIPQKVQEKIHGGPYYSVQVGALERKEKAQILKKDFEKRGYKPFVYSTKIKGKDVHKVLIGKFEKRSEALSLMKRIKSREKLSAFVYTVQ